MKPLLLLRPEPGLAASTARARAMGLEVIEHPLFAIEPVAATLPDGPFDGLVLTSANAVRCGGAALDTVRTLPVHAVGEATAEAARAAGLNVVGIGRGGVEGLDLPDGQRLLHLTGQEHRRIADTESVVVYRALPNAKPLPSLGGVVIAVHSPAAGRALDEGAGADRSAACIAAISEAAATACGDGWATVRSAAAPDDASLLALALTLCQSDAA